MPYISTENVAKIRNQLKARFPMHKFSVAGEHGSINHYHIDTFFENNASARVFLNRIMEAIQDAHGREIVSEDADYGSIPNYYLTVRVGKFGQPYVQTGRAAQPLALAA